MAREQIIIEFKPKGHQPLIKALNALAKAQRDATGESKKQAKAGGILDTGHKRLAKTNGLLANSLATVRSKMLLFSFAMSMGGRQLIQFTKQAARVEAMGRAFDTLSGGVESGSVALEKLRFATDGTMNQFDLFQQANNAMILGVSKNSDEMAEMFDIAQRLGRALGRDTASSVESLITGIGRQSRLMLDNIGIIVKAEEAYDAYAKKLGISADKLTDTQKKQAFLEATMASAREKVATLGDETESSQDSFDRFTATIDDLAVALGTNLKGAFSGAMDAFSEFINVHKSGDMQIALNTMSYEALSLQLIRFKNELENTEAIKASANNIDIFDDGIVELTKNIEVIEKRLKRLITLGALNLLSFLDEDTLDLIKFRIPDDVLNSWDQYVKKVEEGAKINTGTAKTYIGLSDAMKISAIAQEQQTKTIVSSSLQQGMAYDNAGKAAEAALQQVIQSLIQQAIATLMTDAVAKLGWLGVPLAATAGSVVGSLVGQAQRNIKFEQGGLVGGRRHSQGGTMIEAERGEFVMRRSAVQSVGLENLNRMNEGGGATSNVTVNVSGNVMSQDYVEGELAEQIKEAVRRGADIGVG